MKRYVLILLAAATAVYAESSPEKPGEARPTNPAEHFLGHKLAYDRYQRTVREATLTIAQLDAQDDEVGVANLTVVADVELRYRLGEHPSSPEHYPIALTIRHLELSYRDKQGQTTSVFQASSETPAKRDWAQFLPEWDVRQPIYVYPQANQPLSREQTLSPQIDNSCSYREIVALAIHCLIREYEFAFLDNTDLGKKPESPCLYQALDGSWSESMTARIDLKSEPSPRIKASATFSAPQKEGSIAIAWLEDAGLCCEMAETLHLRGGEQEGLQPWELPQRADLSLIVKTRTPKS